MGLSRACVFTNVANVKPGTFKPAWTKTACTDRDSQEHARSGSCQFRDLFPEDHTSLPKPTTFSIENRPVSAYNDRRKMTEKVILMNPVINLVTVHSVILDSSADN